MLRISEGDDDFGQHESLIECLRAELDSLHSEAATERDDANTHLISGCCN